jgi:hypothetical protein
MSASTVHARQFESTHDFAFPVVVAVERAMLEKGLVLLVELTLRMQTASKLFQLPALYNKCTNIVAIRCPI